MTEALPGAKEVVVLLIDDQPLIGEAVRRMFAGEAGITFHYCRDPLAAVATAERVKPTVILQDLVMPGIDGLTLVKQLRENPATRDVPLIVLSTKEEPATKEEAFALGANDYLVKLPHQREMLARIRYHSRAFSDHVERDEAFRRLEAHGKFIRDTFGRYLSDEIVASLLESPAGLSIGGETRTVTIMMADVRGFTPLTESLAPQKVVALLNNFLEVMTEVIVRHGGTIDEILGDALLVIFGAPILRPDDARRAVACAVAMQLAMSDVNAKNAQDGLPPIEIGIGINTGDVVCGNIGSHHRAKYGIVGANVNLTSRIQSYAVGGDILASAATIASAGADVRVDGTIEVLPKGVKAPVVLHEVRGIGEPYSISLPIRDAALVPLAEPLAATFALVEGKDVASENVRCRIVAVSEVGAEMESEHPPKPFSDLRIDLVGASAGAIYGRVLPRAWASSESRFLVRCTSVPEGVKRLLRPPPVVLPG